MTPSQGVWIHCGLPLAYVRARRKVRAAKASLVREIRAGVDMKTSYINFMVALGIDPWNPR